MITVYWYGSDTEIYEVQKLINDSWTTIANSISGTSYTDNEGTIYDWYRVRTVTDPQNPSPWTPKFKGQASSPNLCKLFGYIYDIHGEPIKDLEIVIQGLHNQFIQNIFIEEGFEENISTDNNGYWETYLVQGVQVNIKIPSLNINKNITIPNQNEVRFEELI